MVMETSATSKLRRFGSAAASAAINLTRPNYFDSNDKGENYELRNDLNSEIQLIKKEAVKKVIANMTVGKDVSNLFADVLKCMQTDDLELKKLVYLYLMNYAKSQPELVILAVNSFCKDTEDPSPLLRALGLRTMACIRLEKILDYLCEPLHRTLKDESPYVRKTAVLCVAKIFDLSPDLVEENGFLETLQGMLTDNNPMVISNVVSALVDIQEAAPHMEVLKLDSRCASKLIGALNECSEWGQVNILDALSTYSPNEQEEVEFAIESIIPRLQHVNPSVVLSSMKVLILYTEKLDREHELRETFKRKLAPALVTLISSPPEIQYIALRNMHLILQKYPDILAHGIRVFFCKYNDPLYIKLEKLKLIILLATEDNVEQIYPELADYAKEVDIDFVRKAIRAIGDVVLQVPNSVRMAMEHLLELAKNEVSYVVQELIITLRDILRRFPGSYDAVIPMLCKDLDQYDDPESRAAYVWLLGEYHQSFENANEIVTELLHNFKLEAFAVQSELFTSLFKLYLADPFAWRENVQILISKGKESTESAEIRDRAVFYQRLLEIDYSLLKSISLNSSIREDLHLNTIDGTRLRILLSHISRLASVYHKLPSEFVVSFENGPREVDEEEKSQRLKAILSENLPASGTSTDFDIDLLNLDGSASQIGPATTTSSAQNTFSNSNTLLDLLGD